MTIIIIIFNTISQMKKAATTKKCASVMGHFEGYDNAPVQCWAHRPTKHVQGYLKSHWTPPVGDYLPRIALADAMVIDFGVNNQVVVLWNHCPKASIQKAQTEATSCIERSNPTIKAKEHS